MKSINTTFDPELDLVLERRVDVSPELMWQAWTRPEHLQKWFAPAPWTISSCELDLVPGGTFFTVMRSPEGAEFANPGCYLQLVENELLVFTDTLTAGFRPAEKPFFTAVITFEADGSGTNYTARAVHGNAADRRKHEEMGFHSGWGTVLDQLVEHMQSL